MMVGNVAGGDGDLGDVGDLDSQDLSKERVVGPIDKGEVLRSNHIKSTPTCSTSNITNFWLRML